MDNQNEPDHGLKSAQYQNVQSLISRICIEYKSKMAFVTMDGRSYAYNSFYSNIREFAANLLTFGVNPGDRVVLCGNNSYNWCIVLFGTMFAKAVPVVMSTRLMKSNKRSCLSIVLPKFIYSNDLYIAQDFLGVPDIPHQYYVICDEEDKFKSYNPNNNGGLYTWSHFLSHSEWNINESEYYNSILVHDLCMVVYTNGNKSAPNPVMLSHDNILFTLFQYINESGISSLTLTQTIIVNTLNTINFIMFNLFIPLVFGMIINFCKENPTKFEILPILERSSPDYIVSNASFYMNLYLNLNELFNDELSGLVKRFYSWAIQIGSQNAFAQEVNSENSQPPGCSSCANSLVLSKIKYALHLNSVLVAYVIGSCIDSQIILFFHSIGVKLLEIFGSSELTGIATFNNISRYKIYSIGQKLSSCEIMLSENKATIFKGRNVFLGYYGKPELTQSVFNDKGYYISDDCLVENNDFYMHSGRISSLIPLPDGIYINPIQIELILLNLLPVANHIIVIGKDRPYLSALIELRCVDTKDTFSSDILADDVISILENALSTAKSIREAVVDFHVNCLINDIICFYNSEYAISPNHYIRRWALTNRTFSLAQSELSYNNELKRDIIENNFKQGIDSLYHYHDNCIRSYK